MGPGTRRGGTATKVPGRAPGSGRGATAPPQRGRVVAASRSRRAGAPESAPAALRPCASGASASRPSGGSARGEKSAAVETVTAPRFELVQTWRSAPPRPQGPGTPARRFPPSAASAPSRPPAGSRHHILSASRPRPALRAPPLLVPFPRDTEPSAKEQRTERRFHRRGRVHRLPHTHARARSWPGPAESRGRLCEGLSRRFGARQAL